MLRKYLALCALTLCSSWALGTMIDSAAHAQGRTDYLNIESPQTHPIEVFRIANRSYIAVVNTPASTVEIWATDERLPVAERFITSVRTGLEPVSVRWLSQSSQLYTTNFLGDSISVIRVKPGSGAQRLRAELVQTTRVTDEPADLAFAPGSGPSGISVFVTHSMLDAYGEYDSRTLEPVAPGSEYIFATVPAGEDIDGLFGPDIFALKHPRSVAAGCGHVFFASVMGGNSDIYDFDIFRRPAGSDVGTRIPGLGTSLFALGFAPGGELLAVGTEARNAELRTEPVVAAADTGFTRNLLHVIEDPCGEAPTVYTRDLNAVPAANLTGGFHAISSTGSAVPDPYQPVAKTEALAQPTDVVAFEAAGGVTKIFVPAFGSDRIGVLEADTTATPLSWPRRTIDIAPVAGTGNPLAGPRGLALKPASRPGGPHATGARLYVANRLDNSVTVIDPVSETVVESFALTQDPTPEYIRQGREFLYSADLSGAGFVSCASCHIDGRTDGLAWNLGLDPSNPNTPIPPELLFDANTFITEFPAEKGWTTTQSLQGLLDWEVDPESQGLFTNAPYHWRGDREDFVAFNVAFDGLLGGSEIGTTEMELFEEMINSIHYPPNPRQPLERAFSGSFGDPQDPATGSGGQRGLKLYHSFRPGIAETCGHCHVLPTSTDNRITDEPFLNAGHERGFFADPQPVSTPTLRGMIQKEATVKLDGNPALPGPYAIAGMEGMGITGWISEPTFLPNFNDFADADRFSQVLFSPDFCGAPFISCPEIQDTLTFIYEMDWGIAPRVGYAVTLHRGNANDAALLDEIQALESQAAKAYLGVAVQAWLPQGETGFWFDVTGATPVYRQESSGTAWTRAQLLASLVRPFDRLVFHGTPLGDEQRLASKTGSNAPLSGPAPSGIELLPAPPLDIYERVLELTAKWTGPVPGQTLLDFGGVHTHLLRVFQHGMIQDGPPDAFGLPGVQWDPPRLFQVAGGDIRPGAELHLFTHWDPQVSSPPNLSLGPEDPGQVLMRRSVLPIYPTDQRTADDRVVWRTAIQARTETLYQLMMGGRYAPGVAATLTDSSLTIPEPPPVGMFDPVAWNWHYVRVVNADGTQTDAGWTRITLQ